MILILPRHCFIYDPDSSPSCTVLYMNLILRKTEKAVCVQHKIKIPFIPSYTNFTNTYTSDFHVRWKKPYVYGKVRVGRNKWYLYFMLFTYGLFRLTRKSIYIYMNELYSLVKSSRQKTITLQCIYLF
jgi:hypothetical protein